MDAASSDKSGIRIEPIAAVHIDSFHHALDVVAREKKYLSMLEATPLPQMREFVMDMIAKGNPQFVATAENQVLGWCDISRHFFPSHAHRGKLGMGILPAYRGKGLGRRLIETTLRAAQKSGFARLNSMFMKTTPVLSLSTKRWDLHAKASSDVRHASTVSSSMLSAWRSCSTSAARHRSRYRVDF
jgi:GNAT superfamily N-acetyltransferase